MPIFADRAYAGEADLEPMVQLINTCATVDDTDDGITVEELRAQFTFPNVDEQRDLRLWVGEDGAMVGFARLWLPHPLATSDSTLSLFVAPEMRWQGLEERMLAWSAGRTREWAAAYPYPITMRVRTKDTNAERITLLETQGFTPRRAFIVMDCPLTQTLPAAPLPPGFTLRQTADDDAQQWVEMFNESFIDHYNHHPMTVADFLSYSNDPNANPDFDWAAISPEGVYAGFCVGRIDPAANARADELVGWIDVLGTRRGFRKIGLGRALLVNNLQRLQAAGMQTARLNVDAESPTGATRLYESVGFRPRRTYLSYVKDL